MSLIEGNLEELEMSSNLFVGFDIGNLHSRVSANEFKNMSESYVLELEAGTYPKAFKCIKDSSDSKFWENKEFLVGKPALDFNPKRGDRVLDDNDHKAKLALPLLVALVWEKIETEDTLIQLGISVPNASALEDKVISHLKGRFRFEFNGVKKTFQIKVVKVYFEGQGVIKQQKGIDRNILMLDLGSDTLIVSQFEGYACKNSIPLESAGVRSLITNIIGSPEINSPKYLGKTPTFQEVLDMFERNTPYVIDGVEITELVNKLALTWITEGLKESKRVMKNAFLDSSSLVATGGGCEIPVVSDFLISNGFRVASNPIWDNADGMVRAVGQKFETSITLGNFNKARTKKASKKISNVVDIKSKAVEVQING
ncbi:MAG: hypothetical protein KME13_18390 [Myxacorys californica WJT36-NPBG1]|jgi:hypothetical protein|nr:hypothetical protein [Myxacorys californica WJT36-NPBG1]